MIRKIKTSLTAKLFLATTVLLILVCLLSVFSMARYIPQAYSNRLSAELQKQANDLVPVLEKAGSLEECYSLVQQFTAQTKATAYIEDDYGDILYSSDKLTITTDKDSIATIQENPDSAIITSDELLTEAGYVFTLLGSDYTLYVQSDTVSVNQATEAIWQTVPLVILGIFFMSLLFSVIYSRYITKPIIELSSTSQKMAQLNFEPHGNSNRSDEIGILSDSLNTLSDNLQHTLAELKKSNSELEAEISKERELEKKQQEFFSAASHELKTPLTILKGHLMGMLNKVKGYENQESYMERSLAVVEKMETLVKELLYVSKTDGKQRTEYKTIDFAELLRVQIADVTDLLSEKEISLSVDIPDKILCDADPAQMERAIQNVLVNAIRYSPNGEAIYISLTWLEKARGCSVSTRNQRLMALRSFLDFAGQIDCTQTSLYLSACNIPSKEAHGRIVEFLTEPALTALLQQPNPSRQKDQRNLVFMILMYDTAARCSELLDMKVCDLRLDAKHPIAYLHGKGRKTRTVPLLNRTVQHCKQYLNKFHPNKDDYSEAPLFYTMIHGRQQKMSPDTVAAFFAKYGSMAKAVCQEVPEHIHPHMMRHTRAMHLYQSGMPMVLLSQYLGHAQVETTMIYAYADTEMKRAAIQKADAVRGTKPVPDEIWADNEEMILKLSGLL